MKYEEAIRQLEEIVGKMERDELTLDELTTQLQTAQKLMKLCKDKLTKTEAEIKNLMENVAEKQ